MRKLFEGLWVHEDKMKLAGTNLLLRATLVRLASGGLWVHSPTALSDSLKAEVDALGEVEFVVAPNNAHNLWFTQWCDAYPKAARYVAAGIPKKLPKLAGYTVIDPGATPWKDDLDQAVMGGAPFFDESVFLHRASKSLIVTDLVHNHDLAHQEGLGKIVTMLLLRPLGFKDVCIAPPLKWGFFIKDRVAFRRFIETIRGWEFDRIIVTHGDIIEERPREQLAEICQRFAA